MGIVISQLRGVAKGLTALLHVLADMNKQYQSLLKRVAVPAGLPHKAPTHPYWLDNPPFPELVDIQSPSLPGRADIVIIGTGITAAATARSILHECGARADPPGIVVLDARQLCAGATGRNGGHIKASPYEMFGRLRRFMPPERAAALVRFQFRVVAALIEVSFEKGKEIAECRRVETVDLFLDEEGFGKARKEVEELGKWIPEWEVKLWEGDEAQKKFEVGSHVVGALSYQAGAAWPYRLVASVWKDLLEEYPSSLSIETSTPVTSVEVDTSSSHPYQLQTPRGNIQARHVVHATNSHASNFIPGLQQKLCGIKAHMSAQKPGPSFPNKDGLRSWSVVYGNSFDYVTQLPGVNGEAGDIMLGGGFARSLAQGVDMVGNYDDGTTDALTVAHCAGVFEAVFGERWGGNVKSVWSGVVGVTGDLRPFVGRVDESLTRRSLKRWRKGAGEKGWSPKKTSGGVAEAGEWISAGYCGDGMVWAWLCGTALGLMIVGADEDVLDAVSGRPGGMLKEWFPQELLITLERVEKADLTNLTDQIV